MACSTHREDKTVLQLVPAWEKEARAAAMAVATLFVTIWMHALAWSIP
jgi:hypothetical protein